MPFENYASNSQQGDSYTRIPTLRIGQPLDSNDATAYPSSMNLVAQYQEAKKSVARIEAVKGSDNQGNATGSVGSGFVVRADGEIATDYHVVKDAREINVTVNNRTYKASIDAIDPKTDLALLRLNSASPNERFQPVQLAPSSQMERGAATIAMGYPAGEQKLYMAPGGFSWAPGGFQGYRRFGDIVGNLQGGLMPGEDPNRTSLEAALNADQGISGGPMFNDKFQVVGVMDVGTTAGTKGDATPVEDLYRLLNSTQQRVQTAGSFQNGYSMQNDAPRSYYGSITNYMSSIHPWAQNYYMQNARAEVNATPTVSTPDSWSSLARMLDRR